MTSRFIVRKRSKKAFLFVLCVTVLSLYVLIYREPSDDASTSTSRYPIIVWWTPFILENVKLISCENEFRCLVTKNRTYRYQTNLAAYLFYGSNFNFTDLPLPRNKTPWAIFHEESPKNQPFFLYREGQSLFDITATFSRHSDFPLPLQYMHDLNLISDRRVYVPLEQKNKLLNKNAPVLYIQSDCDTPIERDDLVRELMKYIKIDSYGACLNNKDLSERYNIEKTLEDLYDDDFMKFVAQYKFTIAIENAICDDYITEKLWRPLIAGSIPIYLGSPSVEDWLPNNNSAILIKDFKNISSLATYIHRVNKDDSLYKKYMQHKLGNTHTKITNRLLKQTLEKGVYGIENNQDFPIPAFECHVCKTVHQKTYRRRRKQSVYNCEEPRSRNENKENWWKSHWYVGKCQAKTLWYLLETLKLGNYTEKMFNKKYNEFYNNNEC